MLVPLLFAALYTGIHFLVFQNLPQTLILGLGLAIGCGFYILDGMILAKYYAEPGQKVQPVSRSLIMLALYWPLAIFVTTSTGSVLGLGLILGLGAFQTWDIVRLHRDEAAFKTYFTIPAKSQLNQLEIKIISAIWSTVFLILAISYFF